MIAYLEVAKKLIKEFKEFKIEHVPRNLNTEADALANLGSHINPEEFGTIPLVHVLSPAIEKESTMSVYEVQTNLTEEEDNSWTKPLKEYLLGKTKPTGKVATQVFAQKASKYCLISNVLFKKSAAGPFLRCLEEKEAQQGPLPQQHASYSLGHP
uniref:RNase H type-1 domain-containing protein n=1 Tax=Chenopodium quinoa TaxID=63459 RepID=A0A803NA50_CHEQI